MLHMLRAVFKFIFKPLEYVIATVHQVGSAGIGSPLPHAPEHGECIYLDYQATTPVWPEVAAAATPFLTQHWGNPSSGHAFARPCAAAVKSARTSVATLIGAKDDEIIFTACGSESDNHAILGALEAEEERRRATGNAKKLPLPHVVASNIEHPAIEQCLEALKKAGATVKEDAADFGPLCVAPEGGSICTELSFRQEGFEEYLRSHPNCTLKTEEVMEQSFYVRAPPHAHILLCTPDLCTR